MASAVSTSQAQPSRAEGRSFIDEARDAMARAIQAGTVWINTYNFYDPAAPFGGYKFSGFGRDLGKEALESYTETKTVWVAL